MAPRPSPSAAHHQKEICIFVVSVAGIGHSKFITGNAHVISGGWFLKKIRYFPEKKPGKKEQVERRLLKGEEGREKYVEFGRKGEGTFQISKLIN